MMIVEIEGIGVLVMVGCVYFVVGMIDGNGFIFVFVVGFMFGNVIKG